MCFFCDSRWHVNARLIRSFSTHGGPMERLFWPTIQNAYDADLAATRGFWICFALALVSAPLSSGGVTISIGISIASYLDLAVFILFSRCSRRSQASLSRGTFHVCYLPVGYRPLFLALPFHFSFLRLICLALLLTNLRAAFLIRKWQQNPLQDDFAHGPTRSNSTLRDKFVDQMPTRVWPWGRVVFYILAAMLIPLECAEMVAILMRHS